MRMGGWCIFDCQGLAALKAVSADEGAISMKKLALCVACCSFSIFSSVLAQNIRIENSIDLEIEKERQLKKVANGRSVFHKHNDDENLAGSVILCDEDPATMHLTNATETLG